MRIIGYILLVCMFYACKQTKKVTFDPSNVSIVVKNDQGIPQAGAEVRVYNDQNVYLNSKNNGFEGGYIEKLFTDASGKITVSDLNTEKEYYFLVSYRDRARFVDLNNYDQEFKFNKYLSKGVDTQAEITLQPAKSIVGFYAPTSLTAQLPVVFYVDGDSIGEINQTVATVSGPNQTGLLSFRFSKGTKKWFAYSDKGCFWYGEVNVGATESFSPVAIQTCNAGAVKFHVAYESLNQLPIRITLNKSDVIGTLYGTTDTPTCFGKNVVSAARDTGTVTYVAESVRSGCVWSGTIKLEQGLCKTVLLPKCN